MTRSPIERMLQDYLDGRLTAEERAEFERLIEREPDLAQRVRSARQVGESLREERAELSSDFYARARGRFEAGRAGRPRVFHLLSWEAAGLAAAAVLAFALFVPWFLREPSVAPADSTEEAAVDALGEAGSVGKTEATGEEIAGGEKLSKEAEIPAIPEIVSAPPVQEAPPAPKVAAELDDAEAFAPVPPALEDAAGVGQPSPSSATELRVDQEPAAAAPPPPETRQFAQRRASARAELESAASRGVPLPAGTVAEGEVRIVGQGSRDKSAARRAGRLVLIGPRDGVTDCAAWELLSTAVGWEVRYRPEREAEDREDAAIGGCSIDVPDDGRPVRVVDLP